MVFTSSSAESVTACCYIVLAVLGIYGLWQYRKGSLLRMREEYGTDGIGQREVFWEGIRKRYGSFRSGHPELHLPESLSELLDNAGPPPKIEKCGNIGRYFDDVWTRDSGKTKWEKAMRLFVLSLYGNSKQASETKGTENEKECEERTFEDARSRLGDFWERWTERFWHFALQNRYAKERHCLLILSWLDPAHRRQTKEDHRGKQAMYKLARHMHAKRPK